MHFFVLCVTRWFESEFWSVLKWYFCSSLFTLWYSFAFQIMEKIENFWNASGIFGVLRICGILEYWKFLENTEKFPNASRIFGILLIEKCTENFENIFGIFRMHQEFLKYTMNFWTLKKSETPISNYLSEWMHEKWM